MCGLVGMAGNLTSAHDKIFKHLLILDSLRGEDSTGIATVRRNTGDVKVVKEIGDPYRLFDNRKFPLAMAGFNRVLMGHNRYATTGAVTAANAHPFEFDTLVGVHNGTLKNKWKLDDHMDFKVDSENLYHHIEKRGLRSALDIIEGAWTLVWWDKLSSELNFLRNEERPLNLTYSEDMKVLYWASEAWMLHNVLARAGEKHGDIFPLEQDMLHTLIVDKNGALGKPVVKKAEGVKPAPFTSPPPKVESRKKISGGAYPLIGVAKVDPSYLSKKRVKLELLDRRTDSHGAEFITCFDALMPTTEIRLYPRKDCPSLNNIGGEILGDINGFMQVAKGYYKVNPWMVNIITEAAVNQEIEAPDVFPDARGNQLSSAAWQAKYRFCSWCLGNVVPGRTIFSKDGNECFCEFCQKSPDVAIMCNTHKH